MQYIFFSSQFGQEAWKCQKFLKNTKNSKKYNLKNYHRKVKIEIMCLEGQLSGKISPVEVKNYGKKEDFTTVIKAKQ